MPSATSPCAAISPGATSSKSTWSRADVAYDVSGLPNPYLGLESFTYETRDRFGGREQQVADAVELLTARARSRSRCSSRAPAARANRRSCRRGWCQRSSSIMSSLGKRSSARSCARAATPSPPSSGPAELPARGRRSLGGSGAPPQAGQSAGPRSVRGSFHPGRRQQPRSFLPVDRGAGQLWPARTHVIATVRADYLPSLFDHRRTVRARQAAGYRAARDVARRAGAGDSAAARGPERRVGHRQTLATRAGRSAGRRHAGRGHVAAVAAGHARIHLAPRPTDARSLRNADRRPRG